MTVITMIYNTDELNRKIIYPDDYFITEKKQDNNTAFGDWMQTIADCQLLCLELETLVNNYNLNIVNRTIEFKGDSELLIHKVAHLDRINGKKTLYSDMIEVFNSNNAYAFHGLYPYKGKFYPRLVRALINYFNLDENSNIIDPFNGSGTTTHEASLMNIKSTGIEVTPIGNMISKTKNYLLMLEYLDEITDEKIEEIWEKLEETKLSIEEPINLLYLLLYFDTLDAFSRTNKYNKKGKKELFKIKLSYVYSCFRKIKKVKEKYNLSFAASNNVCMDIMKLEEHTELFNLFDACITSPPYFFSIDYVKQNRIAYNYMNINQSDITNKFIGMKHCQDKKSIVENYFTDVRKSITIIYRLLKQHGKFAIVVGNSTIMGKEIKTIEFVENVCIDIGFTIISKIYNPLIGLHNRGIRGECIIVCRR